MERKGAVGNARERYILHSTSVFFLITLFLSMGAIVALGNVDGQENEQCPVTPDLSDQNWWDYYKRGQEYAKNKCWQQAVQDFIEAIDQNPDDNKRARTAGIRFIEDYFPHRELGFAYYCLGRYADAIRTLKIFKNKISMEDETVQVYLSKAQKALSELYDGSKSCVPLKLENEYWYGYFERGREYSKEQCWQQAAKDFAEAITQRRKDEKKVRTYGLHFSEYFPQREIGIAYYHLGHYLGAFYALKTSLDDQGEDNKLAKVYLLKVKEYIKNNRDKLKKCDGHYQLNNYKPQNWWHDFKRVIEYGKAYCWQKSIQYLVVSVK